MRRRTWIEPAFAVAVLAALALIEPGGPVICPFRLLSELPCPLCGITRGVHALLNLEWRAALNFHLLSPLAAALLAASAVRPVPPAVWTATAILFGAFGVLRILSLTL